MDFAIINRLNFVWWCMFAVMIAITVGFWLIGRKRTPEQKKKMMIILYIVSVVVLVLYKVWLVCFTDTYHLASGERTFLLNELPLNLCQVALLLALPGILLKNRTITSMCFFVGSVCSLMALLMPVDGFEGKSIFNLDCVGFYGHHMLVFIQSVSLITLGFYKPRYKDIPKLLVLFAGLTLFAYGVNTLLRATGAHPTANYFFTNDPEGNAILGFFRGLIDVDFVYLLPMLIPVGGLFAGMAALLRLMPRNRTKDLLEK